jgi:hypothetical protein
MSPPKIRPQLDSSIIRRPGQAAPVQAPTYMPNPSVEEISPMPAPTPPPVAVAPPPASPVVAPPKEAKSTDSMPWLGGRPWTRKLGIRVDEDRARRIKIVAAARGTTMEELLIDAIDQYMERNWSDVSRGLK